METLEFARNAKVNNKKVNEYTDIEKLFKDTRISQFSPAARLDFPRRLWYTGGERAALMEAAGVPAASYMMRRAPARAGSRIVGRWNAAPPQTPVPLTISYVARRQAVRSPRRATPDHTK